MSRQADNRKSIKVSNEMHKVLKNYCKDNGLKMEWYLDKMIKENCEISTKVEKEN